MTRVPTVLRLAAASIAIAIASTAAAYTPADLLSISTPNQAQAQTRLQNAKREYQIAATGLYTTVDANPVYTWGFPDTGPTTGSFSLTGTAEVGYRYDSYTLLDRQSSVLQAEDQVARAKRDDVRRALLISAYIMQDELDVQGRQQDLTGYQKQLDLMKSRLAEGSVSQLDVDAAQFDVQGATLNLGQAKLNLANDRASARLLGLVGEPTFTPVTFALPKADVQSTFDYRELQLSLRQAHARLAANTTWSVIQNVTVTGGYEGRQQSVYANLSLDGGRPGASLSTEYNPISPPQWVVQVSGIFHFSDGTLHAIRDSDQQIADLQQQLDLYIKQFATDVERTKGYVDLRQSQLTLYQNRISNAEQLLAAAQKRVTDLTAQVQDAQKAVADATSAQDKDAAQKKLDDLTRSLESAKNQIPSAERDARDAHGRALSAWSNYVQAVGDYLNVTTGTFALATKP